MQKITNGTNGIVENCGGTCGGNCTCGNKTEKPCPVPTEEVRKQCDRICLQQLVIAAGYSSLTLTNTGSKDLIKDGKAWACKSEYCFPTKGQNNTNSYGKEVIIELPIEKSEILSNNEILPEDYQWSIDIVYPSTPGGQQLLQELCDQLDA